jgi:hypothetical protein
MSVAGQGLQRREILRVIGVAALASHPSSTDKTTTLSILTFSLRTSEYLLQNFNQRVHQRA